jgi:excinuclease ABC subunit A
MDRFLHLRGARTNNLKNINVDIPLKRLSVVTGLSGSGKSSLVFDTLYAEGSRRYTESLSTYIRQFLEKLPRPDIDGLENVSPAIALEQKNHINNSRSTVATMSELYDYLRIMFAKVGRTYCLQCGKPVKKDSPVTIGKWLNEATEAGRFYVLAPVNLPAKATAKDFDAWKQQLIAEGFERLFDETAKEVIELSTLEKKPKTTTLHIIIDRMSRPDDATKDGRFMDAMEQAFSRGGDRVVLAFPPAKDGGTWLLQRFSSKFRCDDCDLDYRVPEPNLLSFNSPLGACPGCNGFGHNLELSEKLIIPDTRKRLRDGAIDPLSKPSYLEAQRGLLKLCEKHKINTAKRYDDLTAEEKKLIWGGFPGNKSWYNGINAFFEELKGWKYKMHVRIFIRRYQETRLCTVCLGARLRPEALAVKVGDINIADLMKMSIENARSWGSSLKLDRMQKETASDVLRQVQGRLDFLDGVGVGYLTLDRLGKTLSGGECQRIMLASQLGNKLCSTLYILDEPSIGLHASDTERLVTLLEQLRDHGNTVVVVEHDLDVVRAADYLIEMGPLAGHKGGEVVAQGTPEAVLDGGKTMTGRYLTGELSIPARAKTRGPAKDHIRITGASEHNLQEVDAWFPLNRLVCVTGLSGSGKTTLVHKTLYNALHRLFHKENVDVGRFQRLYGADLINDVALLDQRPIGRSSRSNPATYMKIYDDIRKIYANQSLSLRRGYTPQFFSFNVDGGRCPVCKGEGEVTIDMHFMAELKLPCEECGGKRFKKDVLEVEFKKKNISQLLHTTIDECIDLFREYPAVGNKLQVLKSVGLGYLGLGQSGTSLSGGESQRLKVASVLADHKASNVLYIFDEPTTGLHVDDVKRLIQVLHSLVDSGHSVIVIEHNLDLIAQADHVIDIGPGGGIHGGKVVATGTPQQIMDEKASLTGRFLKRQIDREENTRKSTRASLEHHL